METANKNVTITVSISTNPSVDGRYFVDLRDTTGGRNHQMTTRTTDRPADFIAEVAGYAERMDIAMNVINTTRDVLDLPTVDTAADVDVATDDDEWDDDTVCQGHESLDGAHMGEAVYCDGRCQNHKRTKR